MNLYEVTYVSYVFKNDKGIDIEKTKTFLVLGKNEIEAKQNFTKQNKKKFISIKIDNSNSMGNICPELIELRNQMLK